MLMKRWLSPVGGSFGFLLIAILVIGGLGWVSIAALHVEKAEQEATARADALNLERLALWQLDSRLFPALGVESNRPYAHYFALSWQPGVVLNLDGDPVEEGPVRVPSPLLSADLPDWMLLHYQLDPLQGWDSPQVIRPELADKIREVCGDPAFLTNVTPVRRELLEQLKRTLPVRELHARFMKLELPDMVDSPLGVPVSVSSPTPTDPAVETQAVGVMKSQVQEPGNANPAASFMLAEPAAIDSAAMGASQAVQSSIPPAPAFGGARGGAGPRSEGGIDNTFALRKGTFDRATQPPPSTQNYPGVPPPLAPTPPAVASPRLEVARDAGRSERSLKINRAGAEPAKAPPTPVSPPTPEVRGGATRPGAEVVGVAKATDPVMQQGRPAETPLVLSLPAAVASGATAASENPLTSSGADAKNPRPIMENHLVPAPQGVAGTKEMKRNEATPSIQVDMKRFDPKPGIDVVARRNKMEAKKSLDESQQQQLPAMERKLDIQSNRTPGAMRPPAVHLGPIRPHWLTADDGTQILTLVRAARLENRVVFQGVILDWPRLQEVLTDVIRQVLPSATLVPARNESETNERHMAAIPVVLEHAPARELPSPGWTPLRIGLLLAWGAALIALAGVGIGGWSLISLSERRIRFVSAVTHELRTPLTSLRIYLDLLTSGMVQDGAKQREYLQTLSNESDRLNRLIENVLDFARLEKRAVPLQCQSVSVSDILEQIRSTWHDRIQADGKELVLVSTLPPEFCFNTDSRIVTQVLGNLIDNARKYSRSATDPRIWVWAKPGDNHRLALEVEDRGPGIPPAERCAIFQPFRRGLDADTTAGGAGLGLALAKQWAEMLGATLTCRAADGGVGACFRLELPIKR